MSEKKLNIIKIDEVEALPSSYRQRQNERRKEAQAKFERLWLTDPERFNPLRNCMERERLERTWGLITNSIDLKSGPHTIDIGCAAGVLSRRLRDAGARVEAIDIAENALKKFREFGADKILLKQETMPETSLKDEEFDLVVCTDLIAEIAREDYRLFFAEIARIIQPTGLLIFSSPIDIDTVEGVEKLQSLVQSEFDILFSKESYHALYLRLRKVISAPSRYIAGYKNHRIREKQLTQLSGLVRLWYKINTIAPFVWFWFIPEFLMNPLVKWLNSSRSTLILLEKICRFMSDRDGISHYLFVAKRRPLQVVDPDEIPVERLGKKEIWD